MNPIKKNVFFALAVATLALLLIGCSQYQYVTLSGNLSQDDYKQFVYENDSLIIKYAFSGRNCPISIEVHNMNSKPIYVDWAKSAVIIEGKRFCYWIDESTIQGYTQGYDVKWNKSFSSNESILSGSITRNERISFIPPHSFITYNPVMIRNTPFYFENKNNVQKVNVYTYNGPTNGHRYAFESQESPFVFRSFLSISTKEDFSIPEHFDHAF